MKKVKRDYTNLTEICAKLGLFPYKGYGSKVREGIYSFQHLFAPIDLSAWAENELSILKTALEQLSKEVDDSYHQGMERSLND